MQTKFSADNLVLYVQNDSELHGSFSLLVNLMTVMMTRAARQLAKANAEWHDDPEADDHALFHAPFDVQFPPEEQLKAIAEIVLCRLRETPAGLKISDELQLK